ncbi:MAG TPA: carbohydrate ABC transporter permease, partial [Ktedonobacterales bacterium]|nr:carbohydrate ABC transporter permease [Ktedonobacterales bacterium]
MSTALTSGQVPRSRHWRTRRRWARLGGIGLAVLLLFWTLLPIYNMLLIALNSDAPEFSGEIWPDEWDFSSFASVWTEDYWMLAHFWFRFGNSVYMGTATMVLTVLLGSLASFSLGRMRVNKGWMITDVALLTYMLPTAFLVIPFVHIMSVYGLADTLWSVIAAMVAFATPYAILIFHQYGKMIPLDLDESAKVDGASPWQIYWRIYMPLMAPALVAVGVYALMLAWNEYIYQLLLLSSARSTTVAVALEQFFDTDEAPWNYMMAIAIIYSV